MCGVNGLPPVPPDAQHLSVCDGRTRTRHTVNDDSTGTLAGCMHSQQTISDLVYLSAHTLKESPEFIKLIASL